MTTKLSGMYDPDAAPEASFDALPAGVYTVKVDAGEVKQTKAGDGSYLQLELLVVEGEHEGRKVFVWFNLSNKNEMAVRIANAQFAALREAVGVLKPKDVEDLKNIRFQVVLKLAKKREKQPDGTYRETSEMVNEVARYIKKGQAAAAPQQGAGGNPHTRNAPPEADDPAPWEDPGAGRAAPANDDIPF